MKSFKNYRSILSEGSILKPDYVVGHKFVYNGKGFKDLKTLGYVKGDVFELVAENPNAVDVGDQSGSYIKYLKAPNGKILKITGNSESAKSGHFTHLPAAGSPPKANEWEDLIVYAYNEINNQTTDSETEAVALKYWDLYKDNALKIAENFNKALKTNRMVQTGRGGSVGKVSLGPIWTAEGAKDKTPKTDIASTDFKEKISLKKTGGSQLASAEKKEGIAIVKAALSDMGADAKFAKDLLDEMELKMQKLISRETTGSLEDKAKAGKKTAEVLDFQKKDKDNKELSAMLQSYINQDTAANSLFAKHVVFEASTGNHKFGSATSPAAANLLGKFDPSGPVTLEPINSISDPIITKYAKNVKPYVAFKKGGASPAYSAFRLGLSKTNEEFETFTDIVLNELNSHKEFSTLLTEDFLQEGPFDMLRKAGVAIRSMGRKALDFLNRVINNIMEGVKRVFKKLVNAGKAMFSRLLKFFGLDISHTNGIVSGVSL
jgi:hypothetical protein